MKGKTPLFLGALFLILAIVGGIGFYLVSTKGELPSQPAVNTSANLTPTTTSDTATQEAQPIVENPLPVGWQTYTSLEYGFKISYPENYQALDDSENLYGYPNGVVLFYQGGQAYDLVVEVWDNKTDYEAKYGSRMDELTVKQVGVKYITLLNNTQAIDNASLLDTFEVLEW